MSRYSLFLVNMSVGLSDGEEEAAHIGNCTYYHFVKLNEKTPNCTYFLTLEGRQEDSILYAKRSNVQEQLEELLKDDYIIN